MGAVSVFTNGELHPSTTVKAAFRDICVCVECVEKGVKTSTLPFSEEKQGQVMLDLYGEEGSSSKRVLLLSLLYKRSILDHLNILE